MSEILHTVHGPIGEFPYGEPWLGKYFEHLALEYANELRVVEKGYGIVALEWDNPGGEYDKLALVRSSYGIPVHYEEGEVVSEWLPEADPKTNHTDVFNENTGIVYYALFALVTKNSKTFWTRTAGVEVVVTQDRGSHDELLSFLPEEFRIADSEIPLDDSEGPLSRFLRIIAYENDINKSIVNSVLRNLTNIRYLPGSALKRVSKNLGLENIDVLGQVRMRSLAENIMRIRQNSGTAESLELLARSATGWPIVVEVGNNLILDTDTGDFYLSTGSWEVISGATLDHIVDSGPIGRSEPGCMEVNVTSAAYELVTAPSNEVLHKGIPVSYGSYYVASAYLYSDTTTNSEISVDWYDADGALISRDTGNTESIDSSWGSRIYVLSQAPIGAYRAVVALSGDNGSSTVYIDDVMFHKATQVDESAVLPYESPRKILIRIPPERVNLFPDPSLQVFAPDEVVGDITVTQSSGGEYGNNTLVVTGNGEAASYITLLEITYNEDEWLTTSIYSKGDGDARLSITWVDYVGDEKTVRGNFFEGASNWLRHSVSSLAPKGTVTAKIRLEVSPTSSSVMEFHGILVEADSLVRPWFDGDSGGGGGGNWLEYEWAGAPYESESMFWMHRSLRWPILGKLIHDYIPLGWRSEIIFGMLPKDNRIVARASSWWSARYQHTNLEAVNTGSSGGDYNALAEPLSAPTLLKHSGGNYIYLPFEAGNSISADTGGFITVYFTDSSTIQAQQNPVNVTFPGEISKVEIRSGSHSGPLIGLFEADYLVGTTYEDTYGINWEIHSSGNMDRATLVDRPMWQFATGDMYTVPNGPAINFLGSSSFTLFMALKVPDSKKELLSKKSEGAGPGYSLSLDDFNYDYAIANLSDGTVRLDASSIGIPVDEWFTLILVRDRNTRYATLWVNFETHPLGKPFTATIGGAPTASRPVTGEQLDVAPLEPGEEDSPIVTPWLYGTYDNSGNLTSPEDLIFGSELAEAGFEISDIGIIPEALSPGEVSQLSAELLF